MKNLFRIFLLGAFGVLVAPQAKAETTYEHLSLVAGCRVHTIDGTLLHEFNGKMCLFMNDGRYVSADADRIVMYGPDKSEVWKISGHFHHQLNWSVDRKSILALSSNFETKDGRRERIDVLRRINLEGKIIAEISAKKIFDDLKVAGTPIKFVWDLNLSQKAEFENTHFNSFYEIPPLRVKSANPSIRAGNFIATSTIAGTFILDSGLTKALDNIVYPKSSNQIIHDAQVLPDGRILFFNNERVRDVRKSGPYSAIEIFDPAKKKSVFEFLASPPEMFYAPICSGVQPMGADVFLISHVSNAFFFLNAKTKKIVKSDVLKDQHGKPNLISVQQINAVDLRDFLKNWSLKSNPTLPVGQ